MNKSRRLGAVLLLACATTLAGCDAVSGVVDDVKSRFLDSPAAEADAGPKADAGDAGPKAPEQGDAGAKAADPAKGDAGTPAAAAEPPKEILPEFVDATMLPIKMGRAVIIDGFLRVPVEVTNNTGNWITSVRLSVELVNQTGNSMFPLAAAKGTRGAADTPKAPAPADKAKAPMQAEKPKSEPAAEPSVGDVVELPRHWEHDFSKQVYIAPEQKALFLFIRDLRRFRGTYFQHNMKVRAKPLVEPPKVELHDFLAELSPDKSMFTVTGRLEPVGLQTCFSPSVFLGLYAADDTLVDIATIQPAQTFQRQMMPGSTIGFARSNIMTRKGLVATLKPFASCEVPGPTSAPIFPDGPIVTDRAEVVLPPGVAPAQPGVDPPAPAVAPDAAAQPVPGSPAPGTPGLNPGALPDGEAVVNDALETLKARQAAGQQGQAPPAPPAPTQP